MKALQEKQTVHITNPFNIGQINRRLTYSAKEASVHFPSEMVPSSVYRDTAISFPNMVIEYIENQMRHPFFMDQAFADMTSGLIPDFAQLYNSYLEIESDTGKLLPTFNFLTALRDFSLTKKEIESLLNNPEPKHILVQNDQVKIILIRWQPGELSDIHGHAIGGGLIKVMHGEIEEKRYTANSQQRLLSKSTYLADHIAYIDDVMGLHSVGNNQNSPALTLHISTPGNYKAKKFEKSN